MRVARFASVGSRVLSTETFLDTEDVSKRRQACLEIELRALRQECDLAIILELKERRAAFDLRLHKTWWGDLQEVVRDERVAEGG